MVVATVRFKWIIVNIIPGGASYTRTPEIATFN
jgi:hypothetical protein